MSRHRCVRIPHPFNLRAGFAFVERFRLLFLAASFGPGNGMTLPWIKLLNNLPDHPKSGLLGLFVLEHVRVDAAPVEAQLARLRALEEHVAQRAWTYAPQLWLWVSRVRPSGDLADIPDSLIARHGGWPAFLPPELFVQGLTRAGLLDEDRKVHDWDEIQGAHRRKLEADAAAKRAARAAAKAARDAAKAAAQNVSSTNVRRTARVEERREEEKRGEERGREEAAQVSSTAAHPPLDRLSAAIQGAKPERTPDADLEQPSDERRGDVVPTSDGRRADVQATSDGHPQDVARTSRGQRAPLMGGGTHALNAALHEPTTVAAFLAEGTSKGQTLAEVWGRAFSAFDGQGGRPTLEDALEEDFTYWRDRMGRVDGHRRWIWPAELRVKLRESLQKKHLMAKRDLVEDEKRARFATMGAQAGTADAMIATEAAKAAAAPDVEARRAARELRDRFEIHLNDCKARGIEWPYVDEHAWKAAGCPAPVFGTTDEHEAARAALEAMAAAGEALRAKAAKAVRAKPPERDLSAAAAALAATRQA